MGAGRLWRCGAIILVPNIVLLSSINTGEKRLRAFEIGRLERMISEILDIILKSNFEIFSQW